ncbi:MAG: M28 family peptidase [candidate division WOR-3 bacterium]|nr:MAG: M28 family peptidase [candidate division WOR-3 bacterium]
MSGRFRIRWSIWLLVLLAGVSASPLGARRPYVVLEEFCAIGERVPGTAGHREARDYIIRNLENPQIDSFYARGVTFYNILKRFPGEHTIGIAAHWDSDIGCPGANDGGSGVALLLSLADTLEKNPAERGIDIIFFDGEDVGKADRIGSQHFAEQCRDEYSFIVVIDMVGDKDLQIFQEGYSVRSFPLLVDSLWEIAMQAAPSAFIPAVRYFIIDDHVSLITNGIRAVNVIDFDYPYWDTRDDTIDKCSEESLHKVYAFLLALVYGDRS